MELVCSDEGEEAKIQPLVQDRVAMTYRVMNSEMERGGPIYTLPSVCNHIVWNEDDGVMEKSDDLKIFHLIFSSHLN